MKRKQTIKQLKKRLDSIPSTGAINVARRAAIRALIFEAEREKK